MEPLLILALLAVAAVGYWLGLRRARPAVTTDAAPEHDHAARAVLNLAAKVPFGAAHPAGMLRDEAFVEGVRGLEASAMPTADLVGLADPEGNNPVLACMALEVARKRGPDPAAGARLLESVGRVRLELLYFYLRALPALLPGRPLVADVLVAIAESWNSEQVRRSGNLHAVLKEFVAGRAGNEERPEVTARIEESDEVVAQDLLVLTERIAHPLLAPIVEGVRGWLETRIDTEFLDQVGRLWTDESGRVAVERILEHEALEKAAAEVRATLGGAQPRSVLLLGEPGVGKSAVARTVLRRLQQAGWTVFEAASANLVAGQMYIGQLEERLTRLVRNIDARRRVIWYVPDFANLAWAGRTTFSRTGIHDFLLPHVESGAIVLLGESQPGLFEELTRVAPRAATALRCIRIAPLEAARSLDLARRWVAEEARRRGTSEVVPIDESLLHEAWQLAEQYLRDRAAPGNLLRFLEEALRQRRDGVPRQPGESAPPSLSVDDLILTLGGMTGLPRNILDEREVVSLGELRRFFDARVMGQPEAVDCLVERVAMIKAGVTDPTRPAGVFLFAGPTGTGKTEIAKTLAAFLFGAEQRLIRLDMSELQNQESLPRILGEPGWSLGGDRSLTESVRKEPFSVVLLDEFEKAHPAVWDLFLQVFDDGRLTDRRGVVADFRHTILILTSNLGALTPTGESLGFGGADGVFREGTVRRAIERSFRREFVNRLDRIVVFRPLGRETMREILRKEIDLALDRRGLRNRAWAVEWEQAALDFLLEQGFTPDLGARPLKRAIERHFLGPLARTIVDHRYPQGDQFLFVRSDGKGLDVVFVDPEASAAGPTAPAAPEVAEDGRALESIVLGASGAPEERVTLETRFARLAERVDLAAWRERKHELMRSLSEPGFWDSPGRFAVLGEIEYRDRIEAGLGTCRSLLSRLQTLDRTPRTSFPRDLLGSLGQQVYLLEVACADVLERRPREAFVEVDAGYGSGGGAGQRDAFARRVGAMYRAWAARRGMQIEPLEESGGDGRRPFRTLFAISGYGAHTILAREHGLHVYEAPVEGDGHAFRKIAIHVRVVPQPEELPEGSTERDPRIALRLQAIEVLAARGRDELGIVRRYRERPSPLVRDDVRGWRTGRIDAVLAGNFDVL